MQWTIALKAMKWTITLVALEEEKSHSILSNRSVFSSNGKEQKEKSSLGYNKSEKISNPMLLTQ